MSDTMTGLIVILVVIAAAMIWGGHGKGWNEDAKQMLKKIKDSTRR
jgi:hypothetical protein